MSAERSRWSHGPAIGGACVVRVCGAERSPGALSGRPKDVRRASAMTWRTRLERRLRRGGAAPNPFGRRPNDARTPLGFLADATGAPDATGNPCSVVIQIAPAGCHSGFRRRRQAAAAARSPSPTPALGSNEARGRRARLRGRLAGAPTRGRKHTVPFAPILPPRSRCRASAASRSSP